MTEADAKTKWCPKVSFSDEGADAYSMNNRGDVMRRDTEPVHLTRCIASDCMAWRWEMRTVSSPDQPPHEAYSEPTDRGYCGAFGKPE